MEQDDLQFDHIVIAIPPAKIAEFKAVIEAYDNLATLRTEDPRRHHLKLYFAPRQRETVEQLLESIRDRFRFVRIS